MKFSLMCKLIIFITILLSTANAQTIRLGTIDGEPENKLAQFEAIANYIQKKLNRKELNVGVEIPSNIDNAIKLIKKNKLDIYIDSVYPTLKVQKKTKISIEAKRWKNGQEGYKSIIFTKKNSSIESIKNLKGKLIAFEDDFSTSAYYIPKKALEKNGITVSNNSNDQSALKYLFSNSEMNSASWVLFDKVDAAATDTLTFESFYKNLYKVIYESKMIPRQLVSFSKNVDKKLKKEILDILLNMHKDKEGVKVLEKFSKTKKFSVLKKDELQLKELLN